jgi:predicted nucleotidyltransferase
LFVEPAKAFYLREIVRRTGGGQGAVQRELRRLTHAGIIKRENVGRAIMYRADPASPVFHDLRGLLAKTAGVAEHLRRALAPLRDRILVVFVYGSYAQETGMRPGSDIDLMVIGDVSFGDVVEHTASVQEALGREINPTVYVPAEFAQRARRGQHFISDVLRHPKLFLIGGPHELERLAQVRVADDTPADARRSARAAGRSRSRSS